LKVVSEARYSPETLSRKTPDLGPRDSVLLALLAQVATAGSELKQAPKAELYLEARKPLVTVWRFRFDEILVLQNEKAHHAGTGTSLRA
jgi:hypothetical protein